jgi:hypothetical protein
MKDLFDTLIGMEAQRTQRSARRKSQTLAGESLRDLMGGSSRDSEMSLDIEAEISRGGRSSILEDFDFDRDFEEATNDLDQENMEVNFED